MLDRRNNLPPSQETDVVRQLRQQLAESKQAEQLWRSIIEGPFDFVIIVDDDSIIRYISRVAFGLTAEEIVGHATPLDFLAEEHHAEVRAKLKAVFETGVSEYYEGYCKEPINRWFLTLVSPFEQGENGIRTLSLQSRDIHDQKEAERNLEESQNRFQQLAENVADCFYLLDTRQNKTLYVSPSVEKVLGVPGGMIYANPQAWMSTVHPEDREGCTVGLRRMMTEDYDYGTPFEYRVQHHGQTRWVQHRAFPIRNDNKEIIRIAGIVKDITERKETASRLLAAEARYRILLETLPVISYVVDPEQKNQTQYISPQIEWKLGYTQKEWTSDPQLWESRIHPDDRVDVCRARDEFQRTGQPLNVAYRLLARDDVVIAVREEATLVPMEGESTSRIHGVLLDVSETVNALAGQRRAQAASLQLVQIQEEERRHLSRELHDEVGQSLTMLRMLLEAVELDAPPVRTEKLQQARDGVQDLMAKVHDLALDLRPGMLDDLGLIPSLVWLTKRVASQSNLKVKFEHDGLADARLSDDIETCVYRVVQEALTNCARHSGGSTVQVRVWMNATALNVQIEDDGAGFDVPTVLEASGRAGLTGIRERASAIGGEFELESQPGKGCRLLVHVPREGSHARGWPKQRTIGR